MNINPDEPLLPQCQNPDGTYDGVKFMAAMSGLPEEEVRAIWEKVKADARKAD